MNKQIKQDILSLLTDKNIKFIPVENKDEEFGALMALGYAFREISKLLDTYEQTTR